VNPDDTDDDGLPDTWELEYFSSLTNMNASTDSDGDRFQDRHEYLAGTNPTNRESYLRMHAPGIGPGGAAPVLRWSSADGKRYTLERSSALSSGFPASVGSGLDASPPLNTVTDVTAAGAGPYFYRVKLAH
jgi:hypothetical protein